MSKFDWNKPRKMITIHGKSVVIDGEDYDQGAE